MEYTLDESKRILIIEKEGAKGAAGGLKPETGGGATNTPGEGEEGEGGGADRSGLEGLCSEKLVDLVLVVYWDLHLDRFRRSNKIAHLEMRILNPWHRKLGHYHQNSMLAL